MALQVDQSTALAEAESESLTTEARGLLSDAPALPLQSDAEYVRCYRLLTHVIDRQKALETARVSILGPLQLAIDRIEQLFALPSHTLGETETCLRREMSAYYTRRKLKEAENDRAQESERTREIEQLTEQAQAAARAGDHALAAELMERATTVVSCTVPNDLKLDGLQTRELWSAEVVSLRDLVNAVARDAVPLRAVRADTTFLNNQARALHEHLAYPGVRSISKVSLAVTR